MGDFFKSIKFKVIVSVIALLLGVMVYSATRGADAGAASGFLGSLFKPLRKFSNSVSTSVETNLGMLVNAQNYYNENQALKEQIADLYKKLADYENIKTEIEELRKFAGIKIDNEQYEFSPPCAVIGRIANDPFGSFIIDRGSNDGIKAFDTVITGEGIVGIVSEASGNYCVVRTLLSPELSVGVRCVESKDTGVIQGDISAAYEGMCKMVFINKEHSIKIGDLIVTSGNSGRFPQDHTVGTVVETGIDSSGLSAYAIIKPAADVKKATSVFVIKSMAAGEGGNED